MKFIGIDFGWEGKPSGLAAFDWHGVVLRLKAIGIETDVAAVLEWVEAEVGGGDAIVAIDAPLIITNDCGMRPVDREISQLYWEYDAGVYPANLNRPCAARTLAITSELMSRGFEHGYDIAPRKPGHYIIEVYPHAATVNLFNLNKIIKYKKGRVEQRRQGLSALRRLLIGRLPTLNPSVELNGVCPNIPDAGGRALKDVEDQLDAITCAYVAAYWWYWGNCRNQAHGNLETGYIVVPNRTTS